MPTVSNQQSFVLALLLHVASTLGNPLMPTQISTHSEWLPSPFLRIHWPETQSSMGLDCLINLWVLITGLGSGQGVAMEEK